MSASTSGPVIDVVIESHRWRAAVEAETIVRRAIVNAANATNASTDGRELAVLLTDDAAIRRLNDQWRGLDQPTNVLSFPAAPQLATVQGTPLGDIAIAYETTAREAQHEGKPFADHLAHLAVHGFLHLLGYDHESDAQAETMEELERVILERLGVPDPYLTHEIGV
jgi:probable rRNA maturation factor